MGRDKVLATIREAGVIAIVRGISSENLIAVADALRAGGIRAIEVTLNTPDALNMIQELRKRYGSDTLIGAGTVLDSETARAAILAGACFIISPSFDRRMVKTCHRYGVLAIPGVLSPTEVLNAWEEGATAVKIFPADCLGPKYIQDLRGPFPHVDMIPVGGISLDNVTEFVKAGAMAVGVGGELVDKRSISEGRFTTITERAVAFTEAVARARGKFSK